MTEREDAANEDNAAAREASTKRNRAEILAVVSWVRDEEARTNLGDAAVITEDVVTVLDALADSLDWGSGFLTDQEVGAALRLMELLAFDPIPEVYQKPPPLPSSGPNMPALDPYCEACGHDLTRVLESIDGDGDGAPVYRELEQPHAYGWWKGFRYCVAADHNCYELAMKDN